MNAAQKSQKTSRGVLLEVAPWLILLLIVAFTGITTFTLPMEMRGSALGG